jgi:thiosulfate/3-mercaptopyruvate sulfurtransferase
MDGPREKWIAEGRETSTTAPAHAAEDFFVLRTDDSIRALRNRVQSSLGTATRLVDVRSPAEFAGEIISPAGYEQAGAQRAGHIPGAASVPRSSAVNEDGTFKSAGELDGSTAHRA